jgi:ABC-type antimicrobial peptide transport system permease subunit
MRTVLSVGYACTNWAATCVTQSDNSGVTAYSVAQKTNEIGIRMALVRLVLAGAFARVLVGLMLGLPLAIAAGKLLSAQLYGVSWWDPPALTVATGALTLCSLVAALIPANRAASISPIDALRTE